MKTVLLSVIVLLLEWVAGFGVLASLRARLPRMQMLPAALLAGMFLHTVSLFGADVIGVPLTVGSMVSTIVVVAVLGHVAWTRVVDGYRSLVKDPIGHLRMSDVVTGSLLAYVLFVPVWASWYFPVTPFDAMAGIDLVARTAVEEGTVNNSVFTDPALQGRLSNQPFYAPFAMLMQVVTRLIGFPFGQIWLGPMALAFIWFMWGSLRRVATSRTLANVLVLLFVMIPELHGYLYLLQTDMINAVMLTVGIVVLVEALRRCDRTMIPVAALFLAGACWSRTETIILVAFGVLATIPLMRRTLGTKETIRAVVILLVPGAVAIAAWQVLYVGTILPQHPDTASELVMPTFQRVNVVVKDLVGDVLKDITLWGWTFILLLVVVVLQLPAQLTRHVSSPDRQAWSYVVWGTAIIVGLVVVGSLFTSAIVEQTLRRGIFKLLPIVYLVMASMPVVQYVGNRLEAWELRRPT